MRSFSKRASRTCAAGIKRWRRCGPIYWGWGHSQWLSIEVNASTFVKTKFSALVPPLLLLCSLPISALDLSQAVIVTGPNLTNPERKAVLMLVEEVQKRT